MERTTAIPTGDSPLPEANSPVPNLPLALYDFRFRAAPESRLPRYAGSAWRGALGWSLKRAVCVAGKTACPDCLLYRSCVYPYLFETPPPPDSPILRKYPAAPHPFALRIESGTIDGLYSLGLHLMGRANHQLPYFVHALKNAGQRGIGGSHSRFELIEVLQAEGQTFDGWRSIYQAGKALNGHPASLVRPPDIPERVALRLLSPLRLRSQGQLVTPAQFRFSHLFGALLRRISLLTAFHTDRPHTADYAGMVRRARQVELLSARLHWYEWTRFSSRQACELQMGGVVGECHLRGQDLEPFWPYLWLGQWTLAGKGATLGLGRYQLDSASLPDVE